MNLLSRLKRARIVRSNSAALDEGRRYFDSWAYQCEYPDVLASGSDPWAHFVMFGFAEGRRPAPFFDRDWYLERYPDVWQSGLDPWIHFVAAGQFDGRSCSPVFDVNWYTKNYLAGVSVDIHPWLYYLKFGSKRRHWPAPYFDACWYQGHLDEPLPRDVNPFVHFLFSNSPACSSPAAAVNLDWIARTLAPLQSDSRIRVLWHAIAALLDDPLCELPGPGFDPTRYLRSSPEARDYPGGILAHFAEIGRFEDQRLSDLFDPGWYAAEYNLPLSDALGHYHSIGLTQGYRPSAEFDPAWFSQFISPREDVFRTFMKSSESRGLPGSREQTREWKRLAETHLDKPRQRIILLSSSDSREIDELGRAQGILADADLITLDVWDTLLSRAWPADASKFHVAHLMHADLLGAGYTGSADDLVGQRGAVEAAIHESADNGEYNAFDVWMELLDEHVQCLEHGTKVGFAERAVAAEVEWEMRNARVRPIGAALLTMALEAQTTVAVLSDYYLSSSALRAIIGSRGLDVSGLDLLVSCECGVSKRGGGLLERARELACVDPSRHLHIGDSRQSDIQPQIEQGGWAMWIDCDAVGRPQPGSITRQSLVASVIGPSLAGLADNPRVQNGV